MGIFCLCLHSLVWARRKKTQILPGWLFFPHELLHTIMSGHVERCRERECVSDRQDVREGKGLGVRDKVGGKFSKGERKRWKE